MFDEDLSRKKESRLITRRIFISTGVSAVFGFVLLDYGKKRRVKANSATGAPEFVSIVEFSDAGRRINLVRVPKIVKSEDEWRQQLTPAAFDIARMADTEMAFTGEYWNLYEKGLFRCVCCGAALFSSETKFDSGTGWPSFWAPIAKENIEALEDHSFAIMRTAVSCRRCDAHLGHVFDDGPKPTGLRYCINSVALRFIKAA